MRLGVNYRPVFYNFNAVYSPKLASHAYLELVAGVGAMSTHLYECSDCGDHWRQLRSCQSSTHFDGDFGAGLKLYLLKGLFRSPRGAHLPDQQQHQFCRLLRHPRRRLHRLHLPVTLSSSGMGNSRIRLFPPSSAFAFVTFRSEI